MNQELTEQPTGKNFLEQFEEHESKILKFLPDDIPPQQFSAVVKRAVQEDPALMTVDDKMSLWLACQRAAQDGLLPDKRQGALVVFRKNTDHGWLSGVQWMPMIGGVRQRLADVGFDLIARVVYAGDIFDYEEGDNQYIVHKPTPLDRERGAPIGAYAKAQDLKTGKWYQAVMRKEDIDKVMACAKTKKVWQKWWDQQACKTAARRLSKELPIPRGTDAADRFWSMIKRENEDFDLDAPPSSSAAADAQAAARARAKTPPVVPFENEDQTPDDSIIDGEIVSPEGAHPGF